MGYARQTLYKKTVTRRRSNGSRKIRRSKRK